MTRVLVIEAAGNLWGSERSLLDLLGSLPQTSVTVCCPPDTPLVTELASRGIRTLPYYIYGLHEKSRWHRLRAAMGVLRACLESRPDVIHLNQAGSYKVARPAAKLLGIPMVPHIRIFEDAQYLARQRPDARAIPALVAISAAVETEIRRYPELARIPVHCVYDSYVRAPAASPGQPPRESHRMACVGRLVPVKAQDVLIRSLAQMREDARAEVECLLVGAGDSRYAASLRELATENHVAEVVKWRGFVREVVPVLRTCGVLVCPSHREPLGRVIFEAWDAGAIPVVFAGSGGAAEIVDAAGAGIIYAEQSPMTLAHAVRAAFALTADERTQMIERGRAWMSANCDPARYGERILAILDRAGGTQAA